MEQQLASDISFTQRNGEALQHKLTEMTLTYHQDPSHGWIEVPLTMIDDLGIASQITPYSYRSEDRGMAYLEEDRDAVVFLRAYEATHGLKVAIVESHLDRPHWIRGLAMFTQSIES